MRQGRERETKRQNEKLGKEEKNRGGGDGLTDEGMVLLKLQRRLAASVPKCGRGKVWLDPNAVNEISMANSRMKEARRKGRHSGYGKPLLSFKFQFYTSFRSLFYFSRCGL